jgi:GH24 family phage-related lysozyme (muramidase)
MSDKYELPKEAILICHGYEGLGGQKDNKFFPYQGGADRKGVLTIGRGHVLTVAERKSGVLRIGGKRLQYANGLTLAEVNQLFTQDMKPRYERIKLYMPAAVSHELAAGLSLIYNCEAALAVGTPGKAWRAGNKRKCAAGFLLYVRSNGKPQLGLWRRRMTEALCLLTGEVLVAKEVQNEIRLAAKLAALGILDLAASLARSQSLSHPWLKSH